MTDAYRWMAPTEETEAVERRLREHASAVYGYAFYTEYKLHKASPLNKLAEKYGTDKGGTGSDNHIHGPPTLIPTSIRNCFSSRGTA